MRESVIEQGSRLTSFCEKQDPQLLNYKLRRLAKVNRLLVLQKGHQHREETKKAGMLNWPETDSVFKVPDLKKLLPLDWYFSELQSLHSTSVPLTQDAKPYLKHPGA